MQIQLVSVAQRTTNKCIKRAFSLAWPAAMQIYWNKRNFLLKIRVQLPQDCFATPTGTLRSDDAMALKTLLKKQIFVLSVFISIFPTLLLQS